ncbi:MAG: IS4 family transposase [Elusimicrobia bacterium]|nr:IS4 family transposase [Elusimicrobiota bacterium]
MRIFHERLAAFRHRLAGEAHSGLAGVLGRYLPARQRRELRRCGQRKRVFKPMVTFWNFLAQVLSPGQPCREAVRQVQASRRRCRQPANASGTGGYCKARARLPEAVLRQTWQAVARQLAMAAPASGRWLGLRVGVVDGTGVSMPDTPDNQRAWPQPSGQKRGCGFPAASLLGLFSLATGAVCDLALGTLRHSELALLPQLWGTLAANFDLLLGDRHFGSFATFCALRQCGLHGVFRLHQRRTLDWHRGRRLGRHDRLFVWRRPRQLRWWLPQPAPETITIRVLKILVPVPGFRTTVVFLSTTLLDHRRFPAEAIAALYRHRWEVELCFRHIKTAMHMEVLRCLDPEMVRRELHMHLTAYNLIRTLMFQAALAHGQDPGRISFKGTCDALRQWAPHLAATAAKPALYRHLFRTLLEILAGDLVPLRPDRSEPRAVKRRKKNYQLLTKPRHLMGNLPHRNHPK